MPDEFRSGIGLRSRGLAKQDEERKYFLISYETSGVYKNSRTHVEQLPALSQSGEPGMAQLHFFLARTMPSISWMVAFNLSKSMSLLERKWLAPRSRHFFSSLRCFKLVRTTVGKR